MSYPRNAASPPRIYVGAVVQIADGAVQTSGVAVTVTPEGGSETPGAGGIAYSAKGGVWYTPTQAETNYTAFMVEASKTGCIPVGTTVVTSASDIPGYAGVDWGNVANKTSTVALTATSINSVTLGATSAQSVAIKAIADKFDSMVEAVP